MTDAGETAAAASPAPDAVPNIVLGVAGGIAAYKACELLRLFTESGHRVRVVPTAAALTFVGEATWAALSGQPVATDVFSDAHQVPHVRLGRQADLVVVAPATADVLARAAHGLADDLLTNTLLTARCPVVFAPAMHTEMWEHPATQANVRLLRERGALVIEPAVGRLTGADTGKGRLPDPTEIFAIATAVLRHDRTDRTRSGFTPGGGTSAGGASTDDDRDRRDDRDGRTPAGEAPRRRGDLAGRHVVVTAGGTREPIDPVRFIGNRSSGKQGYALARTAVARGARVTLIAANVSLPDPAGVDLIRVETTEQLRVAVLAAAKTADAVVMAAAPADFRPARYVDAKIKKRDDGAAPVLELVTNPDIAAELGAAKTDGQVLVAFAAETSDPAEAELAGQRKLLRKRADLIVVNQVGIDRTFGADRNAAVILTAAGDRRIVPDGPKEDLADEIWDRVLDHLPTPT